MASDALGSNGIIVPTNAPHVLGFSAAARPIAPYLLDTFHDVQRTIVVITALILYHYMKF